MRVPTRSAGTRSGVNWMRLKLPRMVCARVLTVSVLAKPGPPSTSRWPWARIATNTRSRKRSCPPTTRLTSYRMLSIKAGTSVWLCSLESMILLLSEWRQAGRRSGAFDRHGEPDADEHALRSGIENGSYDADYFAVGVDQRAARVARIDGGIELDQVFQQTITFRRNELAPQTGDNAGGDRRADAERKADRKYFLARIEIGGSAHGCR